MCFQMCLLYDPHALPVRVYQAELKSLQNVLQKTVASSRKELLFEKYQTNTEAPLGISGKHQCLIAM